MTTTEGPWYHHPLFSRYWTHYVQSYSWYQHQLGGRCYQASSRNDVCECCGSESTLREGPKNSGFQRKGFSRSRKKLSKRKGKEKTKCAKRDKNEPSTDYSFEMEITEQMVEFIKLSEDHRRQLREDRAKAKKESSNEGVEYIDCATATSWVKPQVRSVLPPKEQQGLAESEEAKRLYGASAPSIHAMETAIQLTFDHYCDLYQPKMWPVIPLNI